MSRPRDPRVSKAVETAKVLIEQNPTWSLSRAAREAGDAEGVTLNATTLKYRLTHDPPDLSKAPDGLREDVETSEIPIFERDYSHLSSLSVYPIGDLHLGAQRHEGDRLAEWLRYIADTDGTSIINTGDNTNCALKTSVSEAYDDTLTVGQARTLQTEAFTPVASKIDAVIDGNHEDRVYRATGDSPNAAVCQALDINYSRSVCVVRYTVGDQQYDLFLRHGTGGGRKIGSAINNLQDQENVIDADIYCSGHTHSQVAFVKDIFVPTDTGFERKKRLFVCSASFVGYEEYAAKAGYVPAHIGAPRLYLDGRRHDTHASV